MPKVGVLALQGASRVHREVLTDLGATAVELGSKYVAAPARGIDSLARSTGAGSSIPLAMESAGVGRKRSAGVICCRLMNG